MQSNLKKEIESFYREIEKTIDDVDKQNYIKDKFLIFVENNINNLKEELEKRDMKLQKLSEKSDIIESNISKLENKINSIENDFYEEEEGNFEIICPYCNYEFEADIGEEIKEIRCPECQNIIELEWDGNNDNNGDNGGCCGNGCSHCNGCE